ncbi:MAG: protein kinase, partial [Planctomycetota bacterium]
DIKIIDFGLAYYSNSKYIPWQNMLSVGGTIDYICPQRLKGDISKDSDIYSIGIILYEMLSGKLPYAKQDIFASVNNDTFITPNPPSFTNKNVGYELDRIILKAISLKKSERFQSLLSFRNALKKIVIYNKRKQVDWVLVLFTIILSGIIFIIIQTLLLMM